jgi:hypothetical protein
MAIPALIAGGGALLGGLFSASGSRKAATTQANAATQAAQMQSDAANRAAQLQYDAAIRAGQSHERASQIAANAQIEASKIAAEAARFRPYGITTGFGTSSFDTNRDTGTYTLDPRLAAFRDQYYGGAQDVLDQQRGFDPQQFSQQVFAEQMGLLTPERQAQDEALRASQLSSGRIGFGITGTAAGAGTGGMLNPQQFSLDRARALADAQLAAASREQGQTELDRLIGRGQGLLTYGTGLEALGMDSLKLGLDAGSRASTAGANQAQALLAGGMGAAESRLAGSQAASQGMLTAAQAQALGLTGAAGFGAGGLTGAANARAAGQIGSANTMSSIFQALGGLDYGRSFGSAFAGGNNPISPNASYAPGSANARFQSFLGG